jgi:ferric iron reductase protein FhuF
MKTILIFMDKVGTRVTGQTLPTGGAASDALNWELYDRYFQVSPDFSPAAAFAVPVPELMRPETMDEALERSRATLRGWDLRVAASFLGLAVFGLTATATALLSHHNLAADFAPERLTFRLEPQGEHLRAAFRIPEPSLRPVPAAEREAFVVRYLADLHRTTITPLVEQIARRAGVRPGLIWNQYGSRQIWVREFLSGNSPDDDSRRRVMADCEALERRLAPETFRLRKNPYAHTPRYIEDLYTEGKRTVLRSACCQWYRREGGVKCYTCPLLKPEEREAMRLRHRASNRTES